MKQLTVADLRDRVAFLIMDSIEIHRGSREGIGGEYERPSGPPTDDEISDFVCSNALLDPDTVVRLIDEGPLGFAAMRVEVSEEWLEEFEGQIREWSSTNAWLGADAPISPYLQLPEADQTELWLPERDEEPAWLARAPACLLVAMDLLRERRLLSELHWRDFEELIGALLEQEGWRVTVTRPARDGGVDVVAEKEDPLLGRILSLWQAKKYGPERKVRLGEVRELSAIRDDWKATKGVIVTTGSLTKDALDWVRRDLYRLDFKDHSRVEQWIRSVLE